MHAELIEIAPMAEPTPVLTERRRLAMSMCAVTHLGHKLGVRTGSGTAYSVFYWTLETVKKRGFKGRAKLVSAGRRGSGTAFVLDVWEQALALLSDAERRDLQVLLRSKGWWH